MFKIHLTVQSICTYIYIKMPTNLHALIRYRTLDRCFRDQENIYQWEDLAKACEQEIYDQMAIENELSRRTIMYDIQHMRSGKLGYEAPIEYDRTEGYYYSRPNFSIHQVPLNKSDLGELKTALLILKQFSGNEQITGLEQVLAKMELSLNIQNYESADPIIHFEHSLNEPGQKWVNTLYEHIKDQDSLTIDYQPFGKKSKPIQMSPYLIKEYDNRWFLIGHSVAYDGVITLGLDRIQSIQRSLKPFHQDSGFKAAEWFEDMIGVSKLSDRPKQIIVFRAYGVLVDYLLTKPIHASQKLIKRGKKSARFSVDVIPNYELISTFLSFGDEVEVVKPKGVRKEIMRKGKKLSRRYDNRVRGKREKVKGER